MKNVLKNANTILTLNIVKSAPGFVVNVPKCVTARSFTNHCHVALTHYERFAYVTNTGSDNISTYYVSPWGAIYLVHASTVGTDDAPIDICVAANNYYVYNINSGSHTITGFRRTFLGDLISVSSISGLPDFAAGLVAW